MPSREPNDAKVLVADDDAVSVKLLTRILEHAGFKEIVSTTDSRAVIRMCEAERPDLLILDLAMPEPTGFEILEQLRSMESRPPTVVLSGHEHPAIARQALELGAHSVLTKTAPREEMVAQLTAALGSSS